MIKKYLFILMIILLYIPFLFSEDVSTDANKKSNRAIEIDVGGGINHSFLLTILHFEYTYAYNTINHTNIWPYEHSLAFTIPTSIVFHPIKFFGVGGIHILGCDLSLFYGFYPTYISVQNKFRVINKFGNFNDKKRWLLLEYGISIFDRIRILSMTSGNNLFCFGPSLFIGYEKIFNNPFAFSIGFSFDGLYYNEPEDSNKPANIYPKMEIDYWFLYFGIEMRFRFAYFKELKK